jgi:hypothetical protein
MSKKKTKAPEPMPFIEDVYANLSNASKSIELAKDLTIEEFYELLQNNKRKAISEFVYQRFNQRYLAPFAMTNKEFNSGFAQMAACCLMIETLESFKNGWKDTRYLKDDNGADIYGGMIFNNFFVRHSRYFSDFIGLGNEFYSSIRCGILHQAESNNGWRIKRKGDLYDRSARAINSTRFRNRMRKCLKEYCSELETAPAESDVWKNFKTKMAYIIQNCVAGEMK